MGPSAEFEEGRRIWELLSEEAKEEITRLAGSDLVEATAEDNPPPFTLNPLHVRRYAYILLGTMSLNAQAAEEEYFTHTDETGDEDDERR